jgi:2-keto-4-pentenoate hydratase/2-oxohepta-3-ene-1,7-dioic acid hydratase in catechol pathway
LKFVRFTSKQFPGGTYGIFNTDGRIEAIRDGLFDPIVKTGETLSESEISRYLPPLNPPTILAIGLNYVEHSEETHDKLPERPLLFIKAITSLAGHGDDIVLPAVAPNEVDYEAELCVIIGKKAKNVPIETALDYVFGYTCGHDVSARDCQNGDGQWARGKSFDTFAPIGPYIETEYDYRNKFVSMRLNGETMQKGSIGDMVFKPDFLVSFLSHSMTLEPGTVIFTGTPSGVGFTRKPPVFLRDGDVCEVEVEGLGVLRNKVVLEHS